MNRILALSVALMVTIVVGCGGKEPSRPPEGPIPILKGTAATPGAKGAPKLPVFTTH